MLLNVKTLTTKNGLSLPQQQEQKKSDIHKKDVGMEHTM